MTWLSDSQEEEVPPATPIAMRIRNVGYWRAPPKHTRPRRARNEALNRLLEFVALARTLPAAGDSGFPETMPVIHYLRNVSLDIPRGAAVCVVDIGGESRNAFLRVASRLEAPRAGIIQYHGSVLGLDQLGVMPYAFESVQQNLWMLADVLHLPETAIADAMAEIRSIPDLAGLLDIPAYRVPKWARFDIALGAACCLPADIVVISSLRPLNGALKDLWEGFVKRARARGTTLLMTARNQATLLPWATHVMLLDDGALKAFGPSQVIAADYADFLALALRTPIKEDWPSITDAVDPPDEQDDDDPDDDAMAASMAPGTVFLAGDDVSQEKGGTTEELEGQVPFRPPTVGSIQISQDGAEGTLDAYPRGLNRLESSARKQDQRRFDIERDLHIEFGIQVRDAPIRIQPCLDLWWKDSVHAVRAPGPVLTVAAPKALSCTVTIPKGYLSRAPWSAGILLRTWDRDGNFREFLAEKQSIFTEREKGPASATVPAKLKGILGPLLETCRLETVHAVAREPAASISITPAGEVVTGRIPPLAPVNVHAKWSIAGEVPSSPIRVDIARNGRVLTGTPEQAIPLPPGHVLLIHARIPKNVLTPGRYLVRLTRNPPGSEPRDKRPIVLVAAEFEVSVPDGLSADEGRDNAATYSVDDRALHAELPWHVTGVDSESNDVPVATIEP